MWKANSREDAVGKKSPQRNKSSLTFETFSHSHVGLGNHVSMAVQHPNLDKQFPLTTLRAAEPGVAV